jgi:hypothetical protein
VSVATGTVSRIPGVAAAPNSTMTTMKIPPTSVARVPIHASNPAAIEYGVSGVAYIAWNRRTQWKPASTGKVASNTEPCITEDTSSAGASHWRYGTPPSASAPLPASTKVPSPTPIASRNSAGWMKLPKMDPRHVRT